MLNNLKNTVVIVTGASRGIGKAIAEELAIHGCSLALLARNKTELNLTAKNCEKKGAAHVLALSVDITNKNETLSAIKKIYSTFNSIDVLINNHGIYDYHRVNEDTSSKMEEIINVNLLSTIYLTSQVLPYILKEKTHTQRAIIFNASIAAKHTEAGSAAYCASKFGILGFSHSLFEEIREHNIKVSSICAGYTNTTMLHDKILNAEKMIQPNDIAKTVLFILTSPITMCPAEILIRPQRSPYLS